MPDISPESFEENNPDKIISEIFSSSLTKAEAIEKLRTRLLDLTSRNRLLNYKHPRGRSVQIINNANINLVYDRVYINGGINDIFSGVSKQKALQNVQKMVDLINSKKAEPFVIIGYDANKFMDENKLKTTSSVPTKAGMINLKKNYIDYQNSIADTINNATIVDKFNIPSSMTNDAIHPTSSGQKIIANTILKDLNNRL